MRHRKTILKWSLTSVKVAYRLLATSAETLCRHSFGERYWTNLLGSFAAYFCYAALARIFAHDDSPLVGSFCGFYCLLLAYHFIRISLRGYIRVHSYWTGTSWNMWRRCYLPEGVIHILIEPGIIFLTGMIAGLRDVALATWLEAAALCLCVKETVSAWNQRRQVLDAIDARLESARMNESIQRRMRPRIRGGGGQQLNPVTGAAPQSERPASQREMFSNIDPALQNLFEDREGNAPAPQAPPRGPLDHLPRIASPQRGRRPSA